MLGSCEKHAAENEKRKLAADRDKIAHDQVEDFTPEQTALLRRLRETVGWGSENHGKG